VSLKAEGEIIYFSSVYLDIRRTVEEPAWLLKISKASFNHRHLLAGIDSNSNSDVWGPTTNPRGVLLDKVLFQNGLCVLNEGNRPTFETSRAAACIYIAVATPALASLVTKWKMCDQMHLSDHHLIDMTLQVTPDRMPLRQVRNLKMANWDEFKLSIEASYYGRDTPLLWTAATVDSETVFLHNTITLALDIAAPNTPYRPKKAIFSWWTPELDELKKLTRHAHDYARCRPSLKARWKPYRKLRRCLKARTSSWCKFTSNQVTPKLAARLHRVLQRQAYNKLGLLTKDDGTLTESQEMSHLLLMKEHFPGSSPTNISADRGENSPYPLGATGCHNHPVLVDQRPWLNLSALDLAFKHFGKHKCAGPDRFKPIVLCNLPLAARNALLLIYNASIELQYIPQLWRNAEIIFLPKPGKDDYADRRAF
jgi:hypothetical protein